MYMFPFHDMFEGDDDFDELSLRSRDHAPEEDAYVSRNKQIILGRGKELDDTQPLLLPPANKNPDPGTGKPRSEKEPDKVTVVDIVETEENKKEEPDEILVDLNKK